ncbi:hypothetical protein FIBSPDRAFT_1040008 [Athelia psychrophila]|uniref:Uncharacterized protein n=1 Tax=Athelia psychrophila TaxID=1759441 RepID=A0A166QYG9_9AGAM|nr:hypothetical protein FIBSPDRAFT_1040008 [Fibularhizoctonia sp. CBS 109695]
MATPTNQHVSQTLATASHQHAVALTPDGHPNKPAYISNLRNGYVTRFERLGDLADLENAIASYQQALAIALRMATPTSQPISQTSATAISGALNGSGISLISRIRLRAIEQAVALTPDGHPNKPAYLSNLGSGYRTRFERLGDLADLENSIASHQQAGALTPDGHPNKPAYISKLGSGYLTRFEGLGNLVDLENSIASHQKAVALTPDGHPDKPAYISKLSSAQLSMAAADSNPLPVALSANQSPASSSVFALLRPPATCLLHAPSQTGLKQCTRFGHHECLPVTKFRLIAIEPDVDTYWTLRRRDSGLGLLALRELEPA